MDTLIRANASELNESLIQFIKSHFKGKHIALHIYEAEMDETEFLLSNPVMKQRLLESVANVTSQTRLKEYTLEEINSMAKEAEK